MLLLKGDFSILITSKDINDFIRTISFYPRISVNIRIYVTVVCEAVQTYMTAALSGSAAVQSRSECYGVILKKSLLDTGESLSFVCVFESRL